jgi:hypothetical protein
MSDAERHAAIDERAQQLALLVRLQFIALRRSIGQRFRWSFP